MTRKELIQLCREHGACRRGIRWLSRHQKSPRELWATCSDLSFLWWFSLEFGLLTVNEQSEVDRFEEESVKIYRGERHQLCGARFCQLDRASWARHETRCCDKLRSVVSWAVVVEILNN